MPPEKRLFSHTYFGPIEYYRELLKGDVLIEVHDHYQRQTWMNRCRIQGPNGPQDLSIPIKRVSGKQLSKDVQISYDDNWQGNHWRSLKTAYGNSPFFEILYDDLNRFYEEKFKFLLDLNITSFQITLNWLNLEKKYSFTRSFEEPQENNDFRFAFSPKSKLFSNAKKQKKSFFNSPEPDYSILELVLNQGPISADFL